MTKIIRYNKCAKNCKWHLKDIKKRLSKKVSQKNNPVIKKWRGFLFFVLKI